MDEFNQSLRYDKRMHAADIAGSIVYAKGLARVGILTQDEQRKIVDGLAAVGKEWEQGTVCLLLLTQGLLVLLILSSVCGSARRRRYPHSE